MTERWLWQEPLPSRNQQSLCIARAPEVAAHSGLKPAGEAAVIPSMSAHQVFNADDFMARFRNRARRNRRHGSEAYELVFMTCCPSGLRPIDHRSRRGGRSESAKFRPADMRWQQRPPESLPEHAGAC